MYSGDYQPWRYRCPICGSVTLSRSSQKSIPTMREAGHGRRIAESGHKRGIAYLTRLWKCKRCRARFDQPRDMMV